MTAIDRNLSAAERNVRTQEGAVGNLEQRIVRIKAKLVVQAALAKDVTDANELYELACSVYDASLAAKDSAATIAIFKADRKDAKVARDQAQAKLAELGNVQKELDDTRSDLKRAKGVLAKLQAVVHGLKAEAAPLAHSPFKGLDVGLWATKNAQTVEVAAK